MRSGKKRTPAIPGRRERLLTSAHLGWKGLMAETWRHEPGDHDLSGAPAPRVLIQVRGRARVQRLGATRSSPCESVEGMIWLCPAERLSDGLAIRGGPVEMLHVHLHDGHAVSEHAIELGLEDPAFADHGGFRDALIESIARLIVRELESREAMGALFIDTVAATLEAHLLRRYAKPRNEPTDVPPARGALSLARLDRALTLIEERLAEDLPLPELARAASLSVYHFARAFKAATGLAPHRYILERRVERARELLEADAPALAEIADRCGFASQAHMTHVFKRATGVTPGAFRTSSRRATGASE